MVLFANQAQSSSRCEPCQQVFVLNWNLLRELWGNLMEKTFDINDLLDRCRSALGAKSDYQLAQMLEINKARLSEYRSRKRVPDSYSCTRIAQALNLDPLELIALVEANTARNEVQREFWRSFKFSGTLSNYAWASFVMLGFLGGAFTGGNAEAGQMANSHNVYYVK